jgi:hypothetical protein
MVRTNGLADLESANSLSVPLGSCNPPNIIDGYVIKCYAFCVTVLKHIEGYNASLIFSS